MSWIKVISENMCGVYVTYVANIDKELQRGPLMVKYEAFERF